jgi:transposase-like protein
MGINDEILNQLMKGYEKPEDLLGKDGLFMELKKALVERALAEKLTHHLGYERG